MESNGKARPNKQQQQPVTLQGENEGRCKHYRFFHTEHGRGKQLVSKTGLLFEFRQTSFDQHVFVSTLLNHQWPSKKHGDVFFG